MSGKAGNVVFYESRGRQIVRMRAIPVQPNTHAQLSARSWMSQAAVAYRQLQPSQVLAWTTFATRHLPLCTGNTAFIKLTSKFLQLRSYYDSSSPIPTDPPTDDFSGDYLDVQVTVEEGGLSVQASAANSSSVRTEILLQPLPSPHRAPRPKNYKSHAFLFLTGHESEFLPLPSGPYAPAYRFVKVATGQQTHLIPLPTVLVD